MHSNEALKSYKTRKASATDRQAYEALIAPHQESINALKNTTTIEETRAYKAAIESRDEAVRNAGFMVTPGGLRVVISK